MTTEQKCNRYSGQAGNAGKYTSNGFIPSNKQTSHNSGCMSVILGFLVLASGFMGILQYLA